MSVFPLLKDMEDWIIGYVQLEEAEILKEGEVMWRPEETDWKKKVDFLLSHKLKAFGEHRLRIRYTLGKDGKDIIDRYERALIECGADLVLRGLSDKIKDMSDEEKLVFMNGMIKQASLY
jgi:hypothetical protein